MKIRIATRKSELALFQANLVAEKLIEQLEKDKSNCLSLKYKYELGEKDAYN